MEVFRTGHRAISQGDHDVAIQLCYICEHNHPKHPEDCAPSYDDCHRCRRPTCKKHGRAADEDRFHCIRCLREMGR